MKRVLRYILLGLLSAAMIVCVVFAYITSGNRRAEIVCNAVEVEITDSAKLSFISPKDVIRDIDKGYGRYKGEQIDSIDLVKIEEIVGSRSAIKSNEAYVTPDGTLHIKISQKEPYIRFQGHGRGLYADKNGNLFPLQRNHTAHVMVVDGNLPLRGKGGYMDPQADSTSRVWIKKMISLAEYIDDSKWKNNIVSIHVNSDKDIVLIPREGKEKFIFGQPTEFDRKFELIEKYYTHVKPFKEEDYYSSIDVKYRNQLICRK